MLTLPSHAAKPPARITIDAAGYRVLVDGRDPQLSPLLFNLLSALAAEPGHIVTRAALKQALWPYAMRIDTERRLNTAMRALRAALQDDADRPRLIETVRGRGYRWIGGRQQDRRISGSFRPHAALAGALLLAIGLTTSVAAPIPAADMAPVLKAQSAVDEWRLDPSAANFRKARLQVSAAAASGGGPALHVLKGSLALEGRWDWAGAEREFRRALAIDPGNADARLALAWLHANQGRPDAAVRLVEEMIGSVAMTEDRRTNLGWLLIRLNRPALALQACGSMIASSINALSCSHTASALAGQLERARSVGAVLMRKLAAPEAEIARVAQGPAKTGYARFLAWRVNHFLPADAPWFQKAQILAEAGQIDQALDSLERSVAAREAGAVKIRSTPSFAPLRSAPRFRSLAEKVGLPA